MDRSKFMKGRLWAAAVMVALIAILALPAFAYAAAPFTGEYPVGTLVAKPAVVAVDLSAVPALKAASAKITVGGVAYPTFVTQAGSVVGNWTHTETPELDGSITIVWTWHAASGGVTNATLYCYPPASVLGNGTKAVVATVKTVTNVAYSDSWSFTVALPVVTPPVIGITSKNSQVCLVCHAELAEAVEMGPDCLACHDGNYLSPSHATISGSAPGATIADGHKIGGTLLGPLTKFDGTQGVTLEWESEAASASLNAAYATNLGVTSLTTGQVGTLVTNWAFPTQSVFWASTDPSAPVTAVTGLTPTSVITCSGTNGCHDSSGIAYGPHGAVSWGMDPNYPGDYSYAELTKYVTANLAYSATDPGTAAAYSVPLSVSGIAMFPGAATHANITSATVAAIPTGINGGINVTALANRTDGTTGATAVICAKCHDLENFISAANGGVNAVEGANTAHDSHHQDQLDGSAQCVNCHVGVPHAWKRPRLLVNTDVDEAPMRDAEQIGTTRALSTGAQNTGGAVAGLPNTTKLTPGFGQGFNRQGMQALSGWDQHVLTPATPGHVGMTAWGEPSCEACGDHPGEDGGIKIRIVEGE